MPDTQGKSSFDLLLEGAQKLMKRQMAEIGMTGPQEYRDEALQRYLANPVERVETPDSEAIMSYEYDPLAQTLLLQWEGGGEYLYYGIPPYIKGALDETASEGGQGAGEIANGYVKAGFFPWTRLS